MSNWLDRHAELAVFLTIVVVTGVSVSAMIIVGNQVSARQLAQYVQACQALTELSSQKCETLWRLR